MRETIGSPRLTHLPHSGAGSKGAQHRLLLYPRQRIALRGQEHRPIKCGPIAVGPRQRDYTDPYGDEQPLPKASRRQLTKHILVELNLATLDAIQGEADDFPYHGSIRARNALLLDTELRSGSAMVGFLRTANVDTLIGGTVDLATDPGALARVSNGVFLTAIRTAWGELPITQLHDELGACIDRVSVHQGPIGFASNVERLAH
jgi:hypothetical protein